jgi:hypothetical protein
MNNVKVGDWVVNVDDDDVRLTIGKSYKIIEITGFGIIIRDDISKINGIDDGSYKSLRQKYRNPPREEFRELCEAWLAGASIIFNPRGSVEWIFKPLFTDCVKYKIDPASILPPPDERKERIKQQLLKIDADKLAQLIIDSGIEL